MKKSKKIPLLLISICTMSLLSGCAVVLAGAGAGAGVAYVRGDLEATTKHSPIQVQNATERDLRNLKIHVISSKATGVDGKIVARTAQDKQININIIGEGPQISKLSIRVGIMGDRDMSLMIYEEIKKNL